MLPAFFLLAVACSACYALDNGVALTPPMVPLFLLPPPAHSAFVWRGGGYANNVGAPLLLLAVVVVVVVARTHAHTHTLAGKGELCARWLTGLAVDHGDQGVEHVEHAGVRL
jgi:hypothetical protein